MSGKSPVPDAPSRNDNSLLRGIPSVERLLTDHDLDGLIGTYGRDAVKRHLTRELERFRAAPDAPFSKERLVAALGDALAAAWASSLVRVINASGVIIHTNLGRSPVDGRLWSDAGVLVSHYSNLEFDLAKGERGRRDDHLRQIAGSLFGAEAAILTNNNASAVLLVLATLAAGKEVIVSRGELVEIGGGFRVPDVLRQGGAKLREVGTTNKTRAADFEEAIGEETAALLRVHRSNFEIVGFTESPTVSQLAELGRERGIPLVMDEGAGHVVDVSKYGFSRKETIRELIESGVDVVTCSTDKLIGATQGGLIIGREEIVRKCARHPLMRALRAGKESYALIGAALRTFGSGQHEQRIPIYRMLATPVEELHLRASALAESCGGEVVETRSALGGGTTPTETIPSAGVALPGDGQANYERLLHATIPIVSRIENDRCILDLRTVLRDEDDVLRAEI
ncbi:MAG: L-seryl-tRNA(Sec) selenium transferase [Thermoanaerobaculia bacterium]